MAIRMAKFKLFYCALLSILCLDAAEGTPDDIKDLRVNSEFCKITRSVLFCDFDWKLESVSLSDYPTCTADAKCEAIILQRVHKIHFDTSVCVDLTLKHVSKVDLQGKASSDCSNMGLSIQNVTLDFLKDGMTSVYADESRIKELSLSTRAGQLTVIGSQVDVLSAPDVPGYDASLKIHSSKIKDFKRLRISGKGRLHLLDSTVEDFPPNSLVLDSSKGNLVSGVTFTKYNEESAASIQLSNGSEITLEEIKGAVKISSPTCPSISLSSTQMPPPTEAVDDLHKIQEDERNGNPLERPEGCSSYYWMVTAIALSVIMNFVLLILICYLGYCLERSRKLSQKTLSERLRNLKSSPISSTITEDSCLKQQTPLIANKWKTDVPDGGEHCAV
ncbi:uncharacterized protein LOC135201583 [Macrobrachium nipponense]|uniref:uncharacterized protein LOC135201583 n=1 Tax=Macrobrachium nipponense TaxID=159736 RepID=UPI0030C887DD